MRNFQGIVLIWTQAYREIFKCALVYIGFSCLVGLVSSCLHGYFADWKFPLVGIQCVQNISDGYFLGPNLFLVRISWVLNFFHGYSWVQFFFLEVDFVIQRFSVALYVSKSDKSRNTEIDLQLRISF